MNFFIIMGTLCIFLDVNAESRLFHCKGSEKPEEQKNLTFSDGVVCTKISCDWTVDSTCKNGTYSEVLKWETDIFEIGFDKIEFMRPREIVVRIDLNDDYYIEIKVISDKDKRSVKIILNECSHKEKQCLKNRNFTHDHLDIEHDRTVVAVGFRKDEKMNFATVSKRLSRATNLFGPDNEYEFKMTGFHFNTDETMKITVYSKYDKNYEYDGFVMFLPTSVGGLFFNEHGYLTSDNDRLCAKYYNNPNEKEGLPYIIKEYFKNSENWKAPTVNWTLEAVVPYFDENGMKVKPEQMFIKEEPNSYFNAKKMMRKGCKYVELPETTTTFTEDEITETATTTLKEETISTEDEVTETTIPIDITEKFVPTQVQQDPNQLMGSLSEDETKIALSPITINKVILIPKNNPSEKDINLQDFLKLVGKRSLHKNYLEKGGIERNDYNVQLPNGSFVNLKNYKLKNPPKKEKKKKDTKKKKGGSGGSGGTGDASRGEKQLKIISLKYFVILILMILSV